MRSTIVPACLVLLMLAFTASVASATTDTAPLGANGKLTFTQTYGTGSCPDGPYDWYTYSSFNYVNPAGTSFPLSGSQAYYDAHNCGSYVPSGATPPGPLVLNGSGYTITFIAGDAGGSATYQAVGITGYVDPKYLVVGVTYAPPGPSANTFVQYLQSTFVGNTESLSKSYTNSNQKTIALSFGVNIPLVSGGKITNTYSTTNSETTKSTSTVTTSIQVQQGETTFGTGNYFAPVDNDYDQIWVWLNPVSIFTVVSGSSSVQWNGYGFDGNDQSQMDIVPIALGYLNGHFGAIPPDIQTSINRTWAAGQVWAAGEGPALTSADLAQIASFDPFSVSTYGTDEIGYIPPATQTPDYRFTESQCSKASSFNYLQANPSTTPNIYTCQLTYINLSIQAQEITTSFSETFSTDIAFSGSGFLKALSANLMEASTLSWATDAQSSITTSTTSTANLSVQGPPCNNVVQGEGPCVPVYDASGTQPTQFDVYEDNMYGTFMFAPVHYY